MAEENRNDRDSVADKVKETIDSLPKDAIEPEKRDKLLNIKQLSGEELGGLLVDAAANRFQRPSFLQRLDECANELIQKLGLPDKKAVQLTMEEGRATFWQIRAGSMAAVQCNLRAVLRPDEHYQILGELRYMDVGTAAKAQGVPYEDAEATSWHVEESSSSAEPEEYVLRCLVAMGLAEQDVSLEEPVLDNEVDPE